MGFFFKTQTASQRQSTGSLIVIALVVGAFLGYHLIPALHRFCDRFFAEVPGLLHFLYVVAFLFFCLLVYGHRGKSLFAALGILLLLAIAFWIGINFDLVWDAMNATIGPIPTIILSLGSILILWFLVRLAL